ncbi:hypothetical protein A176_000408 [Myxococcus hansupus]|uniref:Uncharacterized protein n=1 Tax=Pseudomyxococcus hansupus TaxID=1297742 RepID=A0A0H4WJK3_9BACT|nr:hypothetical protein [Myxococcus hansupus]AKQ63496.1 hypothetical protein A176_000408 [Myxococcus hansupus]
MPSFFRRMSDVAWTLTRFIVRAFRFLLILVLVSLPIPVAPAVAALLRPFRKNLPSEVLRKD